MPEPLTVDQLGVATVAWAQGFMAASEMIAAALKGHQEVPVNPYQAPLLALLEIKQAERAIPDRPHGFEGIAYGPLATLCAVCGVSNRGGNHA